MTNYDNEASQQILTVSQYLPAGNNAIEVFTDQSNLQNMSLNTFALEYISYPNPASSTI